MAHDAQWQPGEAPVAVIMLSLNEAHNMESVLANLSGWAREVFLVDSCSVDDTVDIALRHGVQVVQRPFQGFGDQWNFALENLPVTAPWTMKLDPDERLSDALKQSLRYLMLKGRETGIVVNRRLWFMGRRLPVEQPILRAWQTGSCRFSDVAVNEHPMVDGARVQANGYLEHHDSPDLDHWIVKQNRYTTTEAISQAQEKPLSTKPRLLGTRLERRMWLKKHFWKFPGRYSALFLYHWLATGAWRAGRVGWIWSHLRTDVYRYWEYKRLEIALTGRLPVANVVPVGKPDPRVPFFE